MACASDWGRRGPAPPIRQNELWQRPIELEAFEIGVEGGAGDAGSLGIRPKLLQPLTEALPHGALIGRHLRVIGRRSRERRKRHGRQTDGEHRSQT
jgi:hypothetical protein